MDIMFRIVFKLHPSTVGTEHLSHNFVRREGSIKHKMYVYAEQGYKLYAGHSSTTVALWWLPSTMEQVLKELHFFL